MTESQTLLAEYARNGSESDFRELVTRYLDLVYSTALRLVGGDAHLAEDVAQIVFADLARHAPRLPRDVLIGGWLHRDTCFVAGKIMRAQRRRQARERQAAEMKALDDHSEANLAHLGPILDEAINQLGAADRTAILLRFFEHRDFRAIGQALDSNEDTAQKRVSRALGKLHSLLQHRGVALPAAALGTALAAQAVTAAPVGLGATISGAALASAAAGGGITVTLLKMMTMTKLKLGIAGALVAASLTIPMLLPHSSEPPSAEKNPAPEQTEPGTESNGHAATTEADPEVGLVPEQPAPAIQIPPAGPEPNMAAFRPLDEIIKGQRLSAEEARALESTLVQDPEDLAARCQLLGYYYTRQSGSKTAREARQSHVLWFIQHHPELRLVGYAYLDPHLDGPVYAQAKTLWLQQLSNNPQDFALLGNAAEFCLLHDRPTSEALLKQAQALEPANPAWSERLAHLYALDAQSANAGAANQAAAKALEQMENAQANTAGEIQRFYNLNSLAKMALDAGEIEKARAYASALLEQSAQPRGGWDYGEAVYRGNLVLGRIALRQGQLEAAKNYLLASAKTTGSPALGSFGPNMSLAHELLAQGEQKTVLEFFKLCANFWKDEKLAAWTQQVNQGFMPDFGANLSN